MGNKLDSTSLFLAQVNQHTEVLGTLLAGVAQDQINEKLLNHCIVGTSMLANSCSIMELGEWQSALESFGTLLKTYRERGLPWDERIAQITSEFIEREDELAASAGLSGTMAIDEVVCVEGLQALSKEVSELLACQGDTPGGQPEEPMEFDCESPDSARSESARGECIAELRRHVELLTGENGALIVGLGGLTETERDDVRKDLNLVDFYASSSEAILAAAEPGKTAEILATLAPIGHALRDIASAICEGTGRWMTIGLTGEDNSIDGRLLKPVRQVLHHLVADIFLRCEEPDLQIEIIASNEEGALRWKLSDNGNNFIHDSRLDPDEYLAFYPGLRRARTILHQFRSLLWVEPDENGSTRFAFTMPLSLEGGRFKVWRNDGQSVAVLPNQLGNVFGVADVEIGNDSRGEYLTIDSRRVPVLRLGQIYSGAPTDGDRVAVVGFLEKRIAFYVEGDEQLEYGTWHKEAVSAWRGMQDGIVEVGTQRIPLVEANSLLKRYLTIVDVSSGGDASGGVGDDDAEDLVSSSSANSTSTAREIPRSADHTMSLGEEETDVLVVEQSETLRSAIASILSKQRIRTKFVDQLETALDFVNRGHAALIISDFRVPSMAAKALVDRLASVGKNIPVLVTTSHSGENAEVLVRRLGVAGYISKPLRPDEVLSRVSEFLGSPRAPASRI